MGEMGPFELSRHLEDLSNQEGYSEDIRLALRAAADAITTAGECQLATPFKPIYLLRTEDGLRYCCKHAPDDHPSGEPVCQDIR